MNNEHGVPKFRSEAEEAQWWDDHKEQTTQWMEDAVAQGTTTTLSQVLEKARQSYGSPQAVSIGIDADDVSRAQALARKKGLYYEAYLKLLIHEALGREETG